MELPHKPKCQESADTLHSAILHPDNINIETPEPIYEHTVRPILRK